MALKNGNNKKTKNYVKVQQKNGKIMQNRIFGSEHFEIDSNSAGLKVFESNRRAF